jgi:hypothetical protein
LFIGLFSLPSACTKGPKLEQLEEPPDSPAPHSLTKDCAWLFVEYLAYTLLPKSFNTTIDDSCIVDTATITLIETGRFQLLYILVSDIQACDFRLFAFGDS